MLTEPAAETDTAPDQPSSMPELQKSHWIGWSALLISLAALASGTAPHFVLGEPLPNPFAREPEPNRPNGPLAPLVNVNVDVNIHLDEAQEAIGKNVQQQVDRAKAKIGGFAQELKQRIPGLNREGVADALLPENVERSIEAEKGEDIAPEVAEQVPNQDDLMQPVAEENQQEIAPAALAPLKRWTPGRPWFITAAAMAIVCIPFATASWIYERQRVLPGLAIICGVLAVTWQYLLVAVILGVMLAVFVYVLGTLS